MILPSLFSIKKRWRVMCFSCELPGQTTFIIIIVVVRIMDLDLDFLAGTRVGEREPSDHW